jgi:hypothetical protein
MGGARFCGVIRASCGGALEGSLDRWRSIDSGKEKKLGPSCRARTGHFPLLASRSCRSALRRL